jgi:hypothetical protein
MTVKKRRSFLTVRDKTAPQTLSVTVSDKTAPHRKQTNTFSHGKRQDRTANKQTLSVTVSDKTAPHRTAQTLSVTVSDKTANKQTNYKTIL